MHVSIAASNLFHYLPYATVFIQHAQGGAFAAGDNWADHAAPQLLGCTVLTLKSNSPHNSKLDCLMRQLSPSRPASTAGSSNGRQLRAYESTKHRPAANAASRTPSTCMQTSTNHPEMAQHQQQVLMTCCLTQVLVL